MLGRKRRKIEGIEPASPRLALARKLSVCVRGNAFGWLRWRGAPDGARFVCGRFEETFWIDLTNPDSHFELWSLTGREIRRLERASVLSLSATTGSFADASSLRLPRLAYQVPRVALSARAWSAIFERHSPPAAAPHEL